VLVVGSDAIALLFSNENGMGRSSPSKLGPKRMATQHNSAIKGEEFGLFELLLLLFFPRDDRWFSLEHATMDGFGLALMLLF